MMPPQPEDERRRVERIRLEDPIPGKLDDLDVKVLEVGLLGAKIQHESAIPNPVPRPLRLTFEWGREQITFDCRATHQQIQPVISQARGVTVFHSGIEFFEGEGVSGQTVKRMITAHVMRTLQEQRANANPSMKDWIQSAPFFRSDDATTSSSKSDETNEMYLCCRIENGAWKKNPSLKPKQPPDGFTVAMNVSDEELELLCRSWLEGNHETRQMIRICAELSLSAGDAVPGQRYR